jgi:hypothetical protein
VTATRLIDGFRKFAKSSDKSAADEPRVPPGGGGGARGRGARLADHSCAQLDYYELASLLQFLGLSLTAGELHAVFEAMDADKDGHVTYAELSGYVRTHGRSGCALSSAAAAAGGSDGEEDATEDEDEEEEDEDEEAKAGVGGAAAAAAARVAASARVWAAAAGESGAPASPEEAARQYPIGWSPG